MLRSVRHLEFIIMQESRDRSYLRDVWMQLLKLDIGEREFPHHIRRNSTHSMRNYSFPHQSIISLDSATFETELSTKRC